MLNTAGVEGTILTTFPAAPVTALLISAIGIAILRRVYCKRFGKDKRDKKTEDALRDIILSFSRELKREAERLKLITYEVKEASLKSNEALTKVSGIEKELCIPELKTMLENWRKALMRLDEIEGRIRDIIASQEVLATRVLNLEGKVQEASAVPERKVKAIIGGKVLAPLTRTELAILEVLATEGSKTAPEIRDKIKLSREHTARLMKRLYKEGYLERDSNKVPFKYSIKKELEDILKKAEM